MAVDVFTFSQFRAARDQVVNSLVETATPSTFWVHVRLFEDVVLVTAGWQALILGLLLLSLLRESLSKTGPLRFGSENQFPSNFAHEYILVQK